MTCPTARMLDDIDNVYNYLATLAATQWRIIPIAPIGRAKTRPELLLSGGEWKRLLDWIKAKRADKSASLAVTLDEEGFLGPEYERKVRDVPYCCFAGIHIGSILADGSVTSCPSVDRRFNQGNIRERSFKDIWETEFKLFRDRRWMKNMGDGTGACSSCRSFSDCKGNSFHLWDSPGAPGPALCHLKMIGEPAAKMCEPPADKAVSTHM